MSSEYWDAVKKMLAEEKKDAYSDRMEFAEKALHKMGYYTTTVGHKELRFEHEDETIKFFPYTGWATGKTIQDGRGIENLLKQLI